MIEILLKSNDTLWSSFRTVRSKSRWSGTEVETKDGGQRDRKGVSATCPQLPPFDSFRRFFEEDDFASKSRVMILLSSALHALRHSKGVSFKILLASLLAPCFNKTSTHLFFPLIHAIYIELMLNLQIY